MNSGSCAVAAVVVVVSGQSASCNGFTEKLDDGERFVN